MVEFRRKPPQRWVLAGVMLYLVFLLVIPLLSLLGTVVTHGSEVWSALTSKEAIHAMLMSSMLGLLAVGVNAVVGVAGALVLVRQRFRGRALLNALVDLPLALSPVMTGLGFMLLFGRSGLFFPMLDAVGIQVVFATPALVIATLFVTLPFTLREVALVLEELGETEEQAAATLGADAWMTFWRITFPNLKPGLVIGTTLTLARALGEFGAVLVLGGAIANKTQTATTFIHAAVEERQEPAAFGMSLLLAGAAVALLALLQGRKRR